VIWHYPELLTCKTADSQGNWYRNEPYFIVCPTRYRTRHFFNNSNTNEDTATKFEKEYVRCVRNEEECVCSALQISLQYPH